MKNKIIFWITIGLIFFMSYQPTMGIENHPHGIILENGTELQGPNYIINDNLGKVRGSNLFHSFDKFNLHSGESACFQGDNSVQNIISRVTGGEYSWINGTIQSTITDANIYFLNSAGIIFGPDASLDISGSFNVSTADYLRLGENDFYYSTQHNSELLSTESPAAYGFFSTSQFAPIVIQGKGEISENLQNNNFGLNVNNKTISLIGGDIIIEKGTFYDDGWDYYPIASIAASEGRINIASIASEGEVIPTGSDITVSAEIKGKIKIIDDSFINISGEKSGSIYIRGGEFILDNNSIIEAYTEGDTNGGLTDIKADSIIINNSAIFSGTNSLGNSGNIILKSNDMSIQNNSQIISDTSGGGRGGNITIDVKENLLIAGNDTQINSLAKGLNEESGDAGTISIKSKSFLMTNGARVSSDTNNGKGRGGDILISSVDSVCIDENSKIFAGSLIGSTGGNAGTVNIETKQLLLMNGGKIDTISKGIGKGGDVDIIASELISISGEGSKIKTTAENQIENAGDAGNVFIKTNRVTIIDNGSIDAQTLGTGQAGNVTIRASSIELDTKASILSSSVFKNNGGNSGIIDIFSENLITISNLSLISTETFGKGNAGNIKIQTTRIKTNSGIITSASNLEKEQGGKAGLITITSSDEINLYNNSILTTETKYTGNIGIEEDRSNGAIDIKAKNLILISDSIIQTDIISTKGLGGDIWIDPIYLIFNNGKIIGNAEKRIDNLHTKGFGGNVNIHAEYMIYSNTLFYSTNMIKVPQSQNNLIASLLSLRQNIDKTAPHELGTTSNDEKENEISISPEL